MLTDFLYEVSICITTSIKGQKYMFQKIKSCKNCCWVKFKLPYNASVLLIDSDLLSIRGIRWTPEKSGFQVASCIAVHSNTFLYDMKAKWYPKNRFRAKTRRWFFGGDLTQLFEMASRRNIQSHFWAFNIQCNIGSKLEHLTKIFFLNTFFHGYDWNFLRW